MHEPKTMSGNEATQKSFHATGMNALSKEIRQSKEFGKILSDYLKDGKNASPEDLTKMLKSGKATVKMAQIHKKLEENAAKVAKGDQKELEQSAKKKTTAKAK